MSSLIYLYTDSPRFMYKQISVFAYFPVINYLDMSKRNYLLPKKETVLAFLGIPILIVNAIVIYLEA